MHKRNNAQHFKSVNHMMKKLLIVSSVAVLAACSATPEQCDPSVEQSFIQKIACTNSGSYDHRIHTKESKLSQEQAHNSALQSSHQHAQKVNANSTQEVSQKRTQVAQMNQSLSASASALKQKAQGHQKIADQIKAIEQQIQQVNNSGTSDTAKEAQLKALQRKLATYQKALGL